MAKDHVELVTLKWDRAVFAFSFSKLTQLKISKGKRTIAATRELCTVGRLTAAGLKPGASQTLILSWGDKAQTFTFTTLPAPVGRRRTAYGIIADPHISLQPENRKGRLLAESADILAGAVRQINELKLDFVLAAGDITNCGTSDEYRTAAAVMSGLECPFFSVPGDHDTGKERARRWDRTFGARSWSIGYKNYLLSGLDTQRGVLSTAADETLAKTLGSSKLLLFAAHHQLFADPAINASKTKAITPTETQAAALEELSKQGALIYCGHQNVPSTLQTGRALQVACPQTLQYPCGWLLAEEYANGIYHSFVPIPSAIQNEQSRLDSDRAAKKFREPQWRSGYRRGRDVYQANFVYSFKD